LSCGLIATPDSAQFANSDAIFYGVTRIACGGQRSEGCLKTGGLRTCLVKKDVVAASLCRGDFMMAATNTATERRSYIEKRF